MKKVLLSMILALTGCITLMAQKSVWTYIQPSDVRVPKGEKQWIVPQKFKTLSLNFKSFQKLLNTAPMEFSGKKPLSISMPLPNGEIRRYEIFESPCMEPGLSAKYPEIKAYAGYNTLNKEEIIRLDISNNGVKAIINTEEGQVYLDPYARFQNEFYICYYTYDFVKDTKGMKFVCGVEDFKEVLTPDITKIVNENKEVTKPNKGSRALLPLNTYRMALATTGLYSQFIGTTVADVLAELNTAINRINQVTTRDLSVKLILINDEDKIIFFDDVNDGYDDGDLAQMISINPSKINQKVGSNAYDFGHVFGLVFQGGVVGLAQLQSVCKINKAMGGSTLFQPTNDPFWIDIAAHEMGHQMGANHSFNNCGQNENAGTAYEPGSGNTIMSYSGACGSNDVVTNSDAMYNVGALEEILFYMHQGNGNNCANAIAIGNHEPTSTINIPNGFTIPISTPFQLKGVGFDEDGDTLSYSWEQYDLGPQSPLGQPSGNAPSFRVFAPQVSNTRVFPRMDKIVSNSSDKSEVLPTYTRDLNFKMVVRDNHFGGGATAEDLVSFKASDLAGPFLVTYPNTFTTWKMAEARTVTWDVANSDVSPVNCKKVNVLLSSDGGFTYPFVLAKNVPNNGSADIVVPYLPANKTSCRVRVEAADNIFFDISNQSFTINAPTTPALYFNATSDVVKVCLPTTIPVDLTLKAFGGYDSTITFKVIGLPVGATANFTKNPVKPSDSVNLTLDLNDNVPSGNYTISIIAEAPGLDTFTRIINFQTVSTVFEKLTLLTPTQGASGVNQLPTFTWSPSNTAQAFDIELATSPSFGNTTVFSQSGIILDQFIPSSLLEVNKLYFWRIRPTNECKQGEWSEIYAFHTITLTCSTFKNLDGVIGISASGTPTVSSKITILNDGNISDVNIASMKGFHDFFADLDVSLQSPKGTTIKLFTNQCGSFGTSFNFGFDDDAPTGFSCPPTNGKVFKPLQALSAFTNEKSAGDWKLILHDTQISSGGQLTEWNLSICSTVSQSPPFLIINDTLKLKPLTAKKLDTQHLEIGDPNNTPDQLSFTVVKLPANGSLGSGSNIVAVGDKFTQAQINSGQIAYINEQAGSTDDSFDFTVEDGEGGWLGILQFHMLMDANITISTKEELNANILLYPNPVSDKLQIKILQDKLNIDKMDVYNISGSKVQSWNKDQIYSNEMNVNNLTSGVYFVNVFSNQGSTTQKIVIQH